jgi:hypothetical protein
MTSLITKAEYLRETEAWLAAQRRSRRIKSVFAVLVLAALVAVVLGWPCADAVCAPAG